MKRNILVPFDGSPSAVEALTLAILLAKPLQEKVILLNVQPGIPASYAKRFLTERLDEALFVEQQQEIFEKTIASGKSMLAESGIAYEVKKRIGQAGDEICAEAKGVNDADSAGGVRLIVMGSRGMNPIIGGVMGSVSYAVLANAPCPVTVIPFSCAQKP